MTKEEFEKIKPLSKEEYEKPILEMQSPVCFGDKVPEEIEDTDEFLNKLKEKLKDYDNRIIGYSQECMGTFTVKDGKVTDIHLTGIALIPKFRDKERGNT